MHSLVSIALYIYLAIGTAVSTCQKSVERDTVTRIFGFTGYIGVIRLIEKPHKSLTFTPGI